MFLVAPKYISVCKRFIQHLPAWTVMEMTFNCEKSKILQNNVGARLFLLYGQVNDMFLSKVTQAYDFCQEHFNNIYIIVLFHGFVGDD